ncbi:MAG: hypothetical protein ORN85_07955, partial [Sediminibacterium sp.]|nr:hypothetical protein [Sediminibacterium sp.]
KTKFMIKKTFIKIFLIVFIFTIFQNTIFTEKANAYSVPLNDCALTDVSHTEYIFDASGLNGTLPLCFRDTANDTLTLRTGNDFLTGSTINASGQIGNHTFTGSTEYRVNFVKNFTTSDLGVEREINFFLRDTANNEAPATYRLTLKPA